MRVGILKNENIDSHLYWQNACVEKKVNYSIIEFTHNTWLKDIQSYECDLYLACPSGLVPHYKETYDKRLYILINELGKKVYPSYKEIILHEDKAFLSYWLRANNLNAPKTDVFYNKAEAKIAVHNMNLPLVFKTSMGASGSGVNIIRTHKGISEYIDKAFSKKGILPYIGPNLKMGNVTGRLLNVIKNPGHILKRLGVYSTLSKFPQKGFLIVQEYIPHDFEWRVVRIGSSFFAHKKIKKGDKASGTKGIEYITPPLEILDFVRNLCEKYQFNCVAIDIFEHNNIYLINEIQTIFGHVQAYICQVNGKPGRFKYDIGKWHFEEGLFNYNLSYNLRLENALELFLKGDL